MVGLRNHDVRGSVAGSWQVAHLALHLDYGIFLRNYLTITKYAIMKLWKH